MSVNTLCNAQGFPVYIQHWNVFLQVFFYIFNIKIFSGAPWGRKKPSREIIGAGWRRFAGRWDLWWFQLSLLFQRAHLCSRLSNVWTSINSDSSRKVYSLGTENMHFCIQEIVPPLWAEPLILRHNGFPCLEHFPNLSNIRATYANFLGGFWCCCRGGPHLR